MFGQLVVQIQVSSLTPDGYNFASATVYYFLSFSYLSVTQNSSNKLPNLLGNLRIFKNSPFWRTIHNPNAPQEAAWLPRQRCTLSSSRSVPGNRRWKCTSDTAWWIKCIWLIKCHQILLKNCPRARSLKLHESDVCNVIKSSSERYSSMTTTNFIPSSEPVRLKWQNHTKSTLPNKPFQIQYSAHYRAPYYSNISKYHTSDSEHPSPSSRSCGSLESLLRGQPHAPLPCHQWIQWIRKQIRNDYSILLRPLHTPIPPLSASSSKQRHKQRAQAIALPNVHPVSEGNFEWFCWHQSLCALTSAAKVRCELQM